MKSFHLILCLALSMLILLFCVGCKEKEIQLDCSFGNAHFTDDPQALDTFTFSIKGNIPEAIQPDGGVHVISLSVDFPEDFPYSTPAEQQMACFGFPSGNGQCSIVYMFSGSCHNLKTDKTVPMEIYLCPQEDHVVVKFNDTPGSYLVVASKHYADTEDIFACFGNLVAMPGVSTPPVTNATQPPIDPIHPTDGEIDWPMDAKMVHRDGNLVSNGTMMIEGRIVKQEDTNDLLLLNLTLPSTVHYRFTDHTQTDEGFFVWETELPYYFSAGYCYSITANEPVFYHFALDAEMGYFIAEWENLPGQYLIACRDGEVDPAVILAHFQGFIDRFAFAH